MGDFSVFLCSDYENATLKVSHRPGVSVILGRYENV